MLIGCLGKETFPRIPTCRRRPRPVPYREVINTLAAAHALRKTGREPNGDIVDESRFCLFRNRHQEGNESGVKSERETLLRRLSGRPVTDSRRCSPWEPIDWPRHGGGGSSLFVSELRLLRMVVVSRGASFCEISRFALRLIGFDRAA